MSFGKSSFSLCWGFSISFHCHRWKPRVFMMNHGSQGYPWEKPRVSLETSDTVSEERLSEKFLPLLASLLLFCPSWYNSFHSLECLTYALSWESLPSHGMNIFKMSHGNQKCGKELFPKEQKTALIWLKFFSKLSEYQGLQWRGPKTKWQCSSLYSSAYLSITEGVQVPLEE